jgi:hypothetical protein
MITYGAGMDQIGWSIRVNPARGEVILNQPNDIFYWTLDYGMQYRLATGHAWTYGDAMSQAAMALIQYANMPGGRFSATNLLTITDEGSSRWYSSIEDFLSNPMLENLACYMFNYITNMFNHASGEIHDAWETNFSIVNSDEMQILRVALEYFVRNKERREHGPHT